MKVARHYGESQRTHTSNKYYCITLSEKGDISVIELNWQYNEHNCVWEGRNAGWRATVAPNADLVVYTSSIQAEDKSEPIEFAPQSFDSLEEAKTWCEQTIYDNIYASERSGSSMRSTS
jgi:hypothetical protein